MAIQTLCELWGTETIDATVKKLDQIREGSPEVGRRLAEVIFAGTRRFPPDPDVTVEELFLALEDDGLAAFSLTMQRTFEIIMAQYPQAAAVHPTKANTPPRKRFKP